MAHSIQRLRYFDGEYLRSNDFTDEQSYHVAMRRQLNLALHLHGIAYGLEIQQDANSVPPNLLFFSITTGFAIDQLGREIVVSAPYELSSDNVLSRAGLQTGLNEVWIVYTETATGLPAPGYQLCDQPGQNTRWTESFDVRLRLKGAPPSGTGDDPNADLKGVMLGHATIADDPTYGWVITKTDMLGRTYVGIRAQSIVTPDQVDGDTPHNFTDQKITTTPAASAVAPLGYLDIGGGPPWGPPGGPGVLIRGNTYCARNLVVGDDYLIQNADGTVPSLSDALNGNLKLNSDLFLNGNINKNVSGTWLKLDDYIKNLMPDIQVKQLDLNIPANTPSGAAVLPGVATTLLRPHSVDVLASIANLTFQNLPNLELGLISANPALFWQLNLSASGTVNAAARTADITVTWALGTGWPDLNPLVTDYPLTSAAVTLLLIFRPGP
jgi:hypothetical protein